MKPRTLARVALKYIESNEFTFDSDLRKKEAVRQMRQIISGKPVGMNPLEDPIIEIHIGVYVPNFDYPIVPIDEHGEPSVWKENGKYLVPGHGNHVVKGISVSGESYFMSFLESLAPFRNTIIKVDRYTDVKRAAYALVSTMSRIINKKSLEVVTTQPLKIEYDTLLEEWHTHDDVKEFEKEQHKLYIKWLTNWIEIHGRNPDTHMRVLKTPKKLTNQT